MSISTSNRILKIVFYLNDRKVAAEILPETTALELLRKHFKLTGTKESCSEGDCGACTIALGKINGNKLAYKSVNSCLTPAAKLHGCHVITVEGIGNKDEMNVFQRSMLENHAVQCGYCSPGIVMSLFCLFANNSNPDLDTVKMSLEGNLCRCTGYNAIIQAAKDIKAKFSEETDYLPEYVSEIEKELLEFDIEVTDINSSENVQDVENYYLPNSLDEYSKIINEHSDKNIKIINGGTDIMVEANIRRKFYPVMLDISKINELHFIKSDAKAIEIGACVTLKEVANHQEIKAKLPVISETLNSMASEQIRNVGTISGNIANASPIADSVVTLLALEASVIIFNGIDKREVKLKDFYKDYKVTELKGNELIYSVIIPIRKCFAHFEKSSKRRSVDISSVNSACTIVFDGKKIKEAIVAFGGVAKYSMIAKKTTEYLIGKEITDAVIEKASMIAQGEFAPIGDVRGSKEYRQLLIKNHVIKALSLAQSSSYNSKN